MPEGLHQIGAAVGDVAQARYVREWAGREEEPLPEGDHPAPAEKEPEIVLLARMRARRECAQIGPKVAKIAVDDLGKRRIGKGREIVLAVGPIAFAHRAEEIGLAPAADSRFRVRGDVRAVERPEGRLERAAACEGSGVLLLLGVAAGAAAGLCEILAPLRIALGEGVD